MQRRHWMMIFMWPLLQQAGATKINHNMSQMGHNFIFKQISSAAVIRQRLYPQVWFYDSSDNTGSLYN